MDAQTAIATLDPEAWAATGAVKRLAMIKIIQENLLTYAEELGRTDAEMKNRLAGQGAVLGRRGHCHDRQRHGQYTDGHPTPL